MKLLYDEIYLRFPEVRHSLDPEDQGLPYLALSHIVDWLRELTLSELTPELIQRIVDFSDWCKNQPRGETASDDLYTIWVVAFYEKLFKSEVTQTLIPKLVSKADLIDNADYLKTWVGIENYDLALKRYGSL